VDHSANKKQSYSPGIVFFVMICAIGLFWKI
jgi:hypothetical protein